MSDLFDEISEDLQNERYSLLWQRYGKYVIMLTIVAIIITIIVNIYQSHNMNMVRKYGSSLFLGNKYYADSNNEEALKQYKEVIKKGSNGEAAIASLNSAMIISSDHGIDKVKDDLKKLAQTTSYPKEFRELANLLYVHFLVEDKIKDEKTKKDIVEILGNLSENSSIWRYSAEELLALYYYSQNKKEDAQKIFIKLKDDNITPPSIRNRANEMLDLIKNSK